MLTALLSTHAIQISYADTPGPTVTIEQGKRFPFRNQLQVQNDEGKLLYPKWQLCGSFQPPHTYNSSICPDVLLQEGGQEPRLREPQLDQGGQLGQGGPGCDPGHGNERRGGQGGEHPIETPLMDVS